ncbi:J domain-containing protein, partial [Legionella fairfieldensis]|uniref:J domain-containing protein n=1 Tax=Legionella fairfieldensis TaxID=45064 RepID=UPI001041947A
LIQGCLEAPPLAGQPLAAVHEQLLALVCEGYFMGYQSSAAIWRIYRDFFDSLAKLKKSYDKTSSDGSVFSLFLTKLVALYERLKAYIHAHVMKQPPVVQDKDLTRLWAAETRLQESALLQHFHQLSQERKTIQSCQGEDIPNRLKAIDNDLDSLYQKLKVLLAPASYVHQTTEQIGILEDTLLQGVELIQHLEQQFNDVKNEIETFNNTQKKTHSTTAPPPPEQQEKRVALVLSERAKNYCLQLNIDITQPVYTQTITKKYRELAKQYHPDKNQEAPEEAHQQFQAMKSIYDKLCREIKGEQNPDFAQEVADLQRDVDLFCKKSRELKQQLEEQNRIIDQQISALKAESQQNEAT